jgi:hypothetical protein
MSEMAERVARAMHGNRYEWPRPEFAEHREDYREMARRAIAAMREPTEAMLNAANSEEVGHPWATLAWRAMIDAALK